MMKNRAMTEWHDMIVSDRIPHRPELMLGFFDSFCNRTAERRSSAAEASELPSRKTFHTVQAAMLCTGPFSSIGVFKASVARVRQIEGMKSSPQISLQFHAQIGSVATDEAVKSRIENAGSEQEVINLGGCELLSSREVDVKEG
jgi:hypothetical protein